MVVPVVFTMNPTLNSGTCGGSTNTAKNVTKSEHYKVSAMIADSFTANSSFRTHRIKIPNLFFLEAKAA